MSLYAGFSRTPIVHNTEKTHFLGGFSNRGPATGVLEYPEARTILLRNNAFAVAVVSLDFCYLDHSFIAKIRQQLLKERVESIIACTHNHAGICAVHSKDNILGIADEEYLALVRHSIFKSVDNARENCKEVKRVTSHRATLVGNFIMNRTFVDENNFMHKQLQPHTPARVFKDFDREITAIKFSIEDEDYVIANFPCHANVLDRSNTLVGRDFVGSMLKTLENNLGDRKTQAMFLNGAAGDVRPAVWESSLETVTAFGGMLGIQIAFAVKKSCCEALDKSISFQEMDASIAFADGSNLAVPVSCLRIGNQPLITVPGELYSSLGLRIKEAGKIKPMIIGYANGTLGYLPSKECVERNHPEDVAIRSWTVQKYFDGPLPLPDLGEWIVKTAISLLK